MGIPLRRVFLVVIIFSVLTPLMLLLRVSMIHKIGNVRSHIPFIERVLYRGTKSYSSSSYHRDGVSKPTTAQNQISNITNVGRLTLQEERVKRVFDPLPPEQTLPAGQVRSLPNNIGSFVNDSLPSKHNRNKDIMLPKQNAQVYLSSVRNSTVNRVHIPRMKFPQESSTTNSNINLTDTMNSRNCSSRYKSFTTKFLFPDQRILFMDGVGRLGNKMFQYASLLGIARKNGFKPLVHSRSLIVQVFEISHLTNEKYSALPVYFEHAAAQYDPCLETLRKDTDWRLGGYYQSWRYFRDVEQDVRAEFTFKKHVQERVNKTLEELPSELRGRPKVGVHVRRGDMSVASSSKKGYTVASREYFVRAMTYFRERLKNPVFLILSDDMNWTRRNLGAEKDTVRIHKDKETDLAILASCDHSVVSTGTYGWWGAWLAGGTTVYYKAFPKNGSWLDTQYNHQDYFPPSWVGME